VSAGLDAAGFTAAWAAAVAGALSGGATVVLFEPDGSEPGADSWAITSVSYEEDLAGAVVIRGRPLPSPDAATWCDASPGGPAG
jgi:hypothetical protein